MDMMANRIDGSISIVREKVTTNMRRFQCAQPWRYQFNMSATTTCDTVQLNQ